MLITLTKLWAEYSGTMQTRITKRFFNVFISLTLQESHFRAFTTQICRQRHHVFGLSVRCIRSFVRSSGQILPQPMLSDSQYFRRYVATV